MFLIPCSGRSAGGNHRRCTSIGILSPISLPNETGTDDSGGLTMTKDITVQELQEHFADHFDEVRR
ncbi:MAG TPA: hypothetical protein VNN25_14640, partial [Thermoanaerobaculia bacterium]|nr:hypothetical protein [Thermoanaerobaculia bacterium]